MINLNLHLRESELLDHYRHLLERVVHPYIQQTFLLDLTNIEQLGKLEFVVVEQAKKRDATILKMLLYYGRVEQITGSKIVNFVKTKIKKL